MGLLISLLRHAYFMHALARVGVMDAFKLGCQKSGTPWKEGRETAFYPKSVCIEATDGIFTFLI